MVADTVLGGSMALVTALPLAWKWELGLPRSLAAVVAASIASGLLVAAGAAAIPDAVPPFLIVYGLSLVLVGGFLVYRFYRDPERMAPDRDDVVVSPADGRVLYVRTSADGKLPVSSKQGREHTLEELTKTPLASDEAVVVGIALSFLDVHVNRAPVGGAVVLHGHHKGAFRSLKHPESLLENERATTVIERDGKQVAVVLIASRLVRRIVSLVGPGDHVACGQRIGAIRFGSQVDLVLPSEWGTALRVDAGDRVTAGQSVVAVIGEAEGEEPSPRTSAAAGVGSARERAGR